LREEDTGKNLKGGGTGGKSEKKHRTKRYLGSPKREAGGLKKNGIGG